MKEQFKLLFKTFIIFSIISFVSYSTCETHNISDPKTRKQRLCASNLTYYLAGGFVALIFIIFVFKL